MDYSLEQISALADTPVRTIRFYIQRGMVDRPLGSRRTATYSEDHLEQLLTIRKWQNAGLSLEAIKRLLTQPEEDNPSLPAPEPGTISVVSRIHLNPGLELVVDPQLSGLKTEQIRALSKGIVSLLSEIREETNKGDES